MGQRDRAQVAEAVVVVARTAVEVGLFFQVAGGAVVVGRALPALQAVFAVVGGDCDAVFVPMCSASSFPISLTPYHRPMESCYLEPFYHSGFPGL